MSKIFLVFTIFVIFCDCSDRKIPSVLYESETLIVKSTADNIFTHVSYLETDDFGKVGCNGMIYLNGDEAIVFDTPADDTASVELIDWVRDQGKTIIAVVITHFHEDCLGGLVTFHQRGVQSYAHEKTLEILRERNESPLPLSEFQNEITLKIGSEIAKVKFYGAGHTYDNVVGYIPSENALFGGCLVKSVGAGKGYLGDASVEDWSFTVDMIQEELPELKVVIPGHGDPGGTELLDFTIELFR
ncbi:MAG: subclass B1 metallo-beta-lactamase [Cyclobacteriaceae bacterium]|nr:subclass B1 metallo-beta-lactamase [Cyclobacteriaceae bacterium SS2]